MDEGKNRIEPSKTDRGINDTLQGCMSRNVVINMIKMKKLVCCLFCLFIFFSLSADEGMWMLHKLKDDNWNRMRELGFVLAKEQLYNDSGASLKDAVVHFDGGCTGVTVSGKGLIFTNHHCGYDAIQSQSSPEHDYLKDGFIAMTQEEEIPIPGMFIRYLIRTEDLTQQLLDSVAGMESEEDRLEKIRNITTAIEDSLTDDKEFIEASVSSYYSNNAYYLNVYRVFTDIRMVLAPPSSIGKFGGDTDNWMWPRHTGDFSIFRIYASKDNKPAEYSEENVPYIPEYFSPISIKGYENNDFAMTVGYPGRTNRYLSSWGIMQRVNYMNKPRIEARGIKQDIWKEAMLSTDDIRIKYASKYARSSNYWKNSIGMNRGIERMRVIERKQELEQKFGEWASSDEKRSDSYGNVLKMIEDSYKDTDEMQEALTYLLETLISGTELTRLTFKAMAYDITESPENQLKFLEEELRPTYKDYVPELDQKVLAAMLRLAKQKLPDIFLPYIYKEIDKKYKGNYEKYAADVFKKSVVPHLHQLEEVLKDPKKVKKLDKDPAYRLATSVREAFNATLFGIRQFTADQIKAERLFFEGLSRMMPEKNLPPDANSTLRMSYGSIAGYEPYDGAWYDYYTTEKGLFEKYRKGDAEFDIQPELLDLFAAKEFGKYADKNGNLNLCFISNNDITGGNSGSPIYDAEGRVIGLAFDGNWEAMSGDLVFEPEVQKTIGVDIRYVLFLVEKWGKCDRLLKELIIAE